MLSVRWPAATAGSLLFTLESMVKTAFGLKRWNKSKHRVQTELFALWDSLLCRLIPNWLRCADKAASLSSHACDIFKFSFSPFERNFFSSKSKKYNLILPTFYPCVCPVSPFLLSKCVTGLYEIWCKHHVIAAIGVACGDGGGGAGEANGPQIFFLPKYRFFFSLLSWRGAKKKRSRNIFLDFYLVGVRTRKCKTWTKGMFAIFLTWLLRK